jgi:tripartite-type tricarboxylate transporter receptor subunit TctC
MLPSHAVDARRASSQSSIPVAALLLASASLMHPALVGAADFPSRPVRLIVPYPPGGGTDIVARSLAQKLTDAWKQNVIIDNRSGAGGNLGTELGAKAAPDGYTAVIVVSTFTINPSLYKSLPYDSIRDFAPIAQVTSAPYILCVHPSLQVTSVQGLVDLVRAKPGGYNYASAGNGGPPHLSAELFKRMMNVNMVHIPYKGAAPAIVDLLAGQVQVMFASPVTSLPHVRTGRLRGLAVTTARRFAVAPELPTVAESGVPGYEVDGWYGILAPARTPAPLVSAWNAELMKALANPELKERFAKEGIGTSGTTPDVFRRYIATEMEKWGRLVKEIGMTVD